MFETYVTANNATIPVFSNPDKADIREIGTYIRYLIDFKNKKVYVWDSMQIIHHDIAKKFKFVTGPDSYYFGKTDVVNFKMQYCVIKKEKFFEIPDTAWLKPYFHEIITEEDVT